VGFGIFIAPMPGKYVIFLDGQVEIGIGDGLSHGGSITQPDQSILDAARSSASSG
jgi:hypothetical protein